MGRPLVFALNGERVEVAQPDPAMTLLSYIRTCTPLRGTKLGCGEGGCGACVVLLARYDPVNKRVEEHTINSCLAPLCSLDLCAVTTTEGLAAAGACSGASNGGGSAPRLHAVHKRLAGFHASQCGFCTPGMAVALYGKLRQSASAAQPLTAAQAERAVQGNICRCTGYRPILDACKSFAADADLEDLGVNAFWSSCPAGAGAGAPAANAAALPAYDAAADPGFPHFLRTLADAEAAGGGGGPEAAPAAFVTSRSRNEEGRVWVRVRSLDEAFAALEEHRGRDVKLVVGNTSQGVYKEDRPQVLVDISGVPELLALRKGKDGVQVGAAVSIAKLVAFLEAEATAAAAEEEAGAVVYAGLAAHLHRLASGHVRNRASVGGNLVLAQQRGFDSDLATVLLGAGASVTVASAKGGQSVLSVDEFLERGALDAGVLLVSVTVPSWQQQQQEEVYGHANGNGHAANGNGYSSSSSSESESDKEELHFKTFRASPRPLGNSVAYVNAALLARTARQADGKHRVLLARLAFGAFGSKHAVLAEQVQAFLTGKDLTAQLLLEAVVMLKATLVPAAGTHKAAYRTSLLGAYLFDFFRPLVQLPPEDVPPLLQSLPTPTTSPVKKAAAEVLLSRGTQKYVLSDEFAPVGNAAPKVVAELQASGEAVYTDDIPSPEGCLHAAFVISPHALAEVKGIDPARALAAPGAVSLVTAHDIPAGGANRGFSIFGFTESLFATDKVEFHGHPLGVLVADSYEHARDAAAKVDVAYDTDKLGPPVLTMEEAVAKGAVIDLPPFLDFSPVGGDARKALAEAELKLENVEVYAGSQYHFYMEPQAALAVPDEDGQIVVYSAAQGTEQVQQAVAECLAIPMHNVRVITRRLGGGFGGKLTKASTVATACALAAWTLRRPVRMCLDRKTDMLIAGGRHPMKAVYSVGFTPSGKITALQAHVTLDAGWSTDLSPFVAVGVHSSLKKYNWEALAASYTVARTNRSSKTAVRAPGDVQGAFFSESVIERVAAALGLPAQAVRDANLHTVASAARFWGPDAVGGPEGFTLPVLWEQLKASAGGLDRRAGAVAEFNAAHRWRKRGLAMAPTAYSVKLAPRHGRVTAFADGSVVAEVGGIEMGQGLWTKVRQAVAYGLGLLWDGRKAGGSVPVDKVRIVQADSISFGNGAFTGGSTTSELNCAAVLEACKVLVERLRPVKHMLDEAASSGAGGVTSWEAVVATAKMTGVDLSAQAMFNVKPGENEYINVGAAISEVEVDVLTGETVILQTDLLYDCGKSFNPAVDIGQVEGAFVQGVGFFLTEEIITDDAGHQVTEGTWLYKPPTFDNIPRVFNVELLNSAAHKVRILSGKAVGEPPLLLASTVHSAVREAIYAARQDLGADAHDFFRLDSPASIDKVKTHCGLDNVEQYLGSVVASQKKVLSASA